MQLIKFAPKELSRANLIQTSTGILTALTGNADFTALAAQVTAAETTRAAFETKDQEALAAEAALS